MFYELVRVLKLSGFYAERAIFVLVFKDMDSKEKTQFMRTLREAVKGNHDSRRICSLLKETRVSVGA